MECVEYDDYYVHSSLAARVPVDYFECTSRTLVKASCADSDSMDAALRELTMRAPELKPNAGWVNLLVAIVCLCDCAIV